MNETTTPMRRRSPLSLLITTAAALALVAMTGCSVAEDILDEELEAPQSSSDPVSLDEDDIAEDYYTVIGDAEREYQPEEPGVIEYCSLDELERATCAYGELTSSLRDQAQQRGRLDITVDPVGWDHNAETTIEALPDVEGSSDYNGWFYNRSHLIADSLGGEPEAENLVTGTRTQNVGSTQPDGEYAGGMAYTEVIARDYLDTQDADSCPLYYAATPVYQGQELLPRTVIVDIASCDGEIDQRVEVSNTAYGFEIDYTTAAWSPVD